jgi:hypothetical protein
MLPVGLPSALPAMPPAAAGPAETPAAPRTEPSAFERERANVDACPTPTGASSAIDARIEGIRVETAGLLRQGEHLDALEHLVSSALRDGRDLTPSEIFLVQVELSRVQFGLEITSKVVEHATSGTKTVLQTQA